MDILKTVLRALISISLLAYLIYLAEPAKIIEVLNGVWTGDGLGYLAGALMMFMLAYITLSIRWQVLVSGYGLKIPTYVLFQYYLIGLFFNNFLPTGIGGDVLRIYNLIKRSGERTIGFASVLTERLIGITATLILAIFALLFLARGVKTDLLLLIAIGLLFGIFLFFFLIFQDKFFNKIAARVEKITLFRFGERVYKFLEALRFYQDSKIIYLKILFISLISQSLIITMTFLLAKALNIQVSLLYLFFVVPITFILTMLPSINGLGVREGGFVFLLGRIGVSDAAAVSLSFSTILIPMIVSIAGGILFVMQKKIPKKEDIENVEKNL
jgi:glycosyltransferase 2 family protein